MHVRRHAGAAVFVLPTTYNVFYSNYRLCCAAAHVEVNACVCVPVFCCGVMYVCHVPTLLLRGQNFACTAIKRQLSFTRNFNIKSDRRGSFGLMVRAPALTGWVRSKSPRMATPKLK